MQSATVEDAKTIAEVHIRSWRKAYRDLVPKQVLDELSVTDQTEKWEEILSEPTHGVLKLLLEGNIVGFSHSTKSNDDDAKGGVADIHAIYLDPDFMGKGFGRFLMTETLRYVESLGYREATVWVMDTNKQAIGFYRAAGFSDDEVSQPYTLAGGHKITICRLRRTLTKPI